MEPVFGSLVQHYGLCRINVLGRSGAHKVMLLAAIAFNLKKYLKFKPNKVVSMAIAMEREQYQTALGCSFIHLKLIRSELHYLFRVLSVQKAIGRRSCATATRVL